VAIGKVVAHLSLTLILIELKISVEQDGVVTTLNIIFSIVSLHGNILLEPSMEPMCLFK
jgi:hypothetical protein